MASASKEEAARRAYDKALLYTPQCRSCSRGTVLALMDTFDMRDESVFKAATGLHGGIGGMGDVCGSLLGASLILGLACGSALEDVGKANPEESGTPGAPDVPTQLVGQLYKWSRKEFGSVKCRIVRARFEKEMNEDLSARDLPEPERLARLFARCDDLTGRTAARTAEMLWEAMERR
jgi:C_GCAxxG_C_C family probable redox protein